MSSSPYLPPNSKIDDTKYDGEVASGFTYKRGDTHALVGKNARLGCVCINCRATNDLVLRAEDLKFIGSGPFIFFGISIFFPVLLPFSIGVLLYRYFFKNQKIRIEYSRCAACDSRFKKFRIASILLLFVALASILIGSKVKGIIFIILLFASLLGCIAFRLARGSNLKLSWQKPVNGMYKLTGFNFIQ